MLTCRNTAYTMICIQWSCYKDTNVSILGKCTLRAKEKLRLYVGYSTDNGRKFIKTHSIHLTIAFRMQRTVMYTTRTSYSKRLELKYVHEGQ